MTCERGWVEKHSKLGKLRLEPCNGCEACLRTVSPERAAPSAAEERVAAENEQLYSEVRKE